MWRNRRWIMPVLHVRNVPEDLYRRLAKVAEDERRSINSEVLVLLSEALEQTSESGNSKSAAIKRLIDRRKSVSLPGGLPDGTEMIREDRNR
jgi:hypothetical protein